MEAPGECCVQKESAEILTRFSDGGYHARCRVCGRSYLSGELYYDELCIEPINFHFWKESDRAPDADASAGLADYILANKPYYARNLRTGKIYQRVD